jgi:hypothetical protein
MSYVGRRVVDINSKEDSDPDLMLAEDLEKLRL